MAVWKAFYRSGSNSCRQKWSVKLLRVPILKIFSKCPQKGVSDCHLFSFFGMTVGTVTYLISPHLIGLRVL